MLHLLLFSLLPGLVLFVGEAVLQTSGEVWPLPRVTAYQRAHPDSLFLRSVDQLFYAYKYRRILESRPSILVAGSSRTMKFRAPMFGDRADSFYNAGGILNSLRDLHDFSGDAPVVGHASRPPAWPQSLVVQRTGGADVQLCGRNCERRGIQLR